MARSDRISGMVGLMSAVLLLVAPPAVDHSQEIMTGLERRSTGGGVCILGLLNGVPLVVILRIGGTLGQFLLAGRVLQTLCWQDRLTG